MLHVKMQFLVGFRYLTFSSIRAGASALYLKVRSALSVTNRVLRNKLQ
jgi:hypothetical protein